MKAPTWAVAIAPGVGQVFRQDDSGHYYVQWEDRHQDRDLTLDRAINLIHGRQS